MPQSLIPILQQLHHAEGTSLFRYLSHSPPYSSSANGPRLAAVKKISTEAGARVQSLETLLESLAESPGPLNFPTHFAALHFMSIDYLLPRLILDKRHLIETYTHAQSQIPDPLRTSAPGLLIHDFLAAHQADLTLLQTP